MAVVKGLTNDDQTGERVDSDIGLISQLNNHRWPGA